VRRGDIRGPRPLTVLVAIVIAFGFLGNFDYADDLAREAEAKVLRPELARQQIKIGAPRCPKRNAAGAWLRYEVATNSDFRPWTFACHYHEAAL